MMINEDNWVDFVTSFFKVDKGWLAHLTSNWNPLKNESGCNCMIRYGNVIPCDDYTAVVMSRITDEENANA